MFWAEVSQLHYCGNNALVIIILYTHKISVFVLNISNLMEIRSIVYPESGGSPIFKKIVSFYTYKRAILIVEEYIDVPSRPPTPLNL